MIPVNDVARNMIQNLVDANGHAVKREALGLTEACGEAFALRNAMGMTIILASDRLMYDFHGPVKEMSPYAISAILRRCADSIDAAGGVTTLQTHLVSARGASWAPEVPRHIEEAENQPEALLEEADAAEENAGMDQGLAPDQDSPIMVSAPQPGEHP